MRRRWLRRRVFSTVMVHTDTDQTLSGVLMDEVRDGVVLCESRFLEGEAEIALSGRVFVPRSRIVFVQVL